MNYDINNIDWNGIKSRLKQTKTNNYSGGYNTILDLDQKDKDALNNVMIDYARKEIRKNPKKFCEEYEGKVKLKYSGETFFQTEFRLLGEKCYEKVGVRIFTYMYHLRSIIFDKQLKAEIWDKVKRDRLGNYTVQDFLNEYDLKNYYMTGSSGSMLKKNHHAEIITSLYHPGIRWGAFIIKTARTYKAYEIFNHTFFERQITLMYEKMKTFKEVKTIKHNNSRKLKILMRKEMARLM